MRIDTLLTVPASVLDEARSVYLAAFAQAPYYEPPSAADAFVERYERYAVTRDHCRLVLARTDAGKVIGLTLTVVAHPGDWWRDQVAAHLGPDGEARSLRSACVEVVHVAVHPDHRGSGAGRVMMDAVRAEAAAPRAVLAVNPSATAAVRLYERCGWSVIAGDFRPGPLPAAQLMGLDLA